MTAPLLSRIHPLGDRALLVQLGDRIDDATLARVRAAAARVAAQAPSAVTDVVPGYASLAVHYDPARVPCFGGELPHRAMARALSALLAAPGDAVATTGRTVEIPVRYGGDDGPDLDEVARHHGMAVDEVIRRHAAGDYVVHMIGFVPGFPYLGGLDPRLATPRRREPRTLVPAGSVGIGGAQTGVYPVASPGGWQLIGRTPLALFDATRERPALLAVGDRVRFVPVRA